MRLSERARARRGVALFLCLSGLAGPGHALGQRAEPVELTWDAPAECPHADAVRARIRELSGDTPATGAPLRAEATVTAGQGGGYHLRLVIRAGDATGTRSIDGKSCADLAGAAAVALVLLLRSSEPLGHEALAGSPESNSTDTVPSTGGDSATSMGSGTDTPAAGPTVPPEPGRAIPAASNVATASPGRWRGLLQIPLLALGLGPLQHASFGVGFAGGVLVGPWRFVAEGRGWLSQQVTTTSDLEEYGAEIDRFAVTLRACHTVVKARIELAPCLALSLEHLSARGYGPQIVPSSESANWIAAGGGGQARLPVAPWLTLVAGVDIQLQTSRPEITIDGVGSVEQLGPVAATVMVGPEWIL